MRVFYLVGTISYICNAFPIVQSEAEHDVQERSVTFGNGAPSIALTAASASTPLGWISAAGSLDIKTPVGGNTSLTETPKILNIAVDNLAVASNTTSAMFPNIADTAEAAGEEVKRVIKWRGTFVVTTG